MSKGNLIIMMGISGSGKTTWAHEQWKANPDGVVLVGRDKIREMLYGYTEASVDEYYRDPRLVKWEKQVTRYENTLIHEGLNHGKTVIIDSTNLIYKHLEAYKYWNVPTEVMVTYVTPEDAMNRDLHRTRMVGYEVIQRQFNRLRTITQQLQERPIDFTPVTLTMNPDNTPCYIFDIDGTLAHMNRATRSPYDWHKVGEDSPDDAVVDIYGRIMDGQIGLNSGQAYADIIICTGRDESSREPTEKWLQDLGLCYDGIYFRSPNDSRADWIVKEEMWRRIAEDNYILGMFDDRLQVTRRARALGLKVFSVDYGNF